MTSGWTSQPPEQHDIVKMVVDEIGCSAWRRSFIYRVESLISIPWAEMPCPKISRARSSLRYSWYFVTRADGSSHVNPIWLGASDARKISRDQTRQQGEDAQKSDTNYPSSLRLHRSFLSVIPKRANMRCRGGRSAVCQEPAPSSILMGIASGRIVVDGPVVAMENEDNTSLVDEGKGEKGEKKLCQSENSSLSIT